MNQQQLIDGGADPANLPVGPRPHSNIAHSNHGPPELDVEGQAQQPTEAQVPADEVPGPVIRPQPLVRLQDPTPVPDVGEVGGVEPVLAPRVHRHPRRPVVVLRAERPEGRQEVRRDRR
ncbi:unnamed protein product, partial [Linum tenue]